MSDTKVDSQLTINDETQQPSEEAVNDERGIDVSNWQGNIDWGKVAKAGIKHVCMKMTEGESFVDASFVKNWNGAKGANIKVNCYHYFLASASTSKQLKNIKDNATVVKFDPVKNILAIDVELTGNEKASSDQMADNLNALLNLIKKDSLLGRSTVMIYTSPGYWDSNVNSEKYNFGAYPLWVAHWKAQKPRLPKSWKEWSWWQYSAEGSVEGIEGNVDLDWIRTKVYV